MRRRHLPTDGMVRIELTLLPDEAERVWQALTQTRLALSRAEDATAVASPAATSPNLADAAVALAEAQHASAAPSG